MSRIASSRGGNTPLGEEASVQSRHHASWRGGWSVRHQASSRGGRKPLREEAGGPFERRLARLPSGLFQRRHCRRPLREEVDVYVIRPLREHASGPLREEALQTASSRGGIAGGLFERRRACLSSGLCENMLEASSRGGGYVRHHASSRGGLMPLGEEVGVYVIRHATHASRLR